MGKYSYSKINLYEQCGFRYKLQYVDGHYINEPSIATDFGTLMHYIMETQGNRIKEYIPVNFDELKEWFINGCDEVEVTTDESGNQKTKVNHIKGINELRETYPTQFYEEDKVGRTYEDKANYFLTTGIYRLKDFLMENPDLEIIATEKPFNVEYNGQLFHGFIDICFKDVNTGKIVVTDYKSYAKPIDAKDLTTPLQFVVYCLALQEEFNTEDFECIYELPLCDIKRQFAGTKGFMKRGLKKLDKILESIASEDYTPNPTPLCHWCPFSRTYINGQPEEAKNLCPYHSNWTRADNKNFSTYADWLGLSEHEAVLESYIKKFSGDVAIAVLEEIPEIIVAKPIPTTRSDGRMVFIRRK